jgi:hypothetical protein
VIDDWRFPSREHPLREAQSETNLRKRVEQIHETEAARFARRQVPGGPLETQNEAEEMCRTADEVLKIKTDKPKRPRALWEESSDSE